MATIAYVLYNHASDANGGWITVRRGAYRLLADVPVADAAVITYEERFLTGVAHPIEVSGTAVSHDDGAAGDDFSAYQDCAIRASRSGGAAVVLVHALLLET